MGRLLRRGEDGFITPIFRGYISQLVSGLAGDIMYIWRYIDHE